MVAKMASAPARLLSLFGSSNLLHSHTPATNLYTFPAIRFPITLFSSPTPRFRRYASSSATVTDDDSITGAGVTEATGNCQQHPWPEWVTFVDRLKTKGYLLLEVQNEGESEIAVYKDMSVLKDACLSFARDRFDIFKSLSRQDIQTLVEKGCPNIYRKTVNSGKRLRAYLNLDEGDACSNCILRGSCDRAYVILKDFEAAARTVDIVRILLNYALDPVINSSDKPSGAELVEASARKLLLELTELSETTVDPELPKPAAAVAQKKKSFESNEGDRSRNVEMQKGDWICTKCNFMNFYRNRICRECNEDGPRKAGGENIEMKKGDWICTQCNFMNFSRNFRCLKCKTEGPKRVGTADVEMKKGDWNCPQCRFMNFASNTKCLRCRESRPKRQLSPGDWECPSCDFPNFSGNIVCRKCNCKRPENTEAKYEEQIWRKPS